jgi:hypothetical protein
MNKADWPMGHLVKGELKAQTRNAILIDRMWVPRSQIEGEEISDDKAKLIISDWFFKEVWSRKKKES